MSNLRDATVVRPPSLIKKKKNGADKYIFAPIIGMGGSIEILQVQRFLVKKIPRVLIPRIVTDFLATRLRGIKIKRHWFGSGERKKLDERKVYIKPVFL